MHYYVSKCVRVLVCASVCMCVLAREGGGLRLHRARTVFRLSYMIRQMFERVTACGDQRGHAMLFSTPLWYHFATVLPWNTERAWEPPPPHPPILVHRLKNAPDCLGSWPLHRWWKWGFTGVAIWHCRRSYKHWGRPVLALLKPSSRPVRFIVNYGRFWGRRSQVHSYINPALFMGNYKTPRIFFLPPETSFEVSVRCCHFFKTCLLVDFCSLESFAARPLSLFFFFF